ncbi:GTPase IMAP family member 7-like [Oncorhynchus mykiss]|nr:GTPase IMAP family member 7-like [Oncorhynchus mykiss]
MERKREEEIERRRREEGEDMEEKVTVKPLVNCLQSTPTQQQQPKKPQNGGPALFTRIPSFHLTEEGAILSHLSELEAKPAQKVVNTFCHRINSIGEKTTSYSLPSSSSSSSQSELRVVLLGRSGSGKSAAGNIILGREEFVSRPDITTAVTQDCQKSRALVAGRRVAVVDTPDWFRSEHPPDVVRSQLSSCVALSAPGPHAFILCVPVDQPAQAELQALGALEKVFGPGAVRTHTLVLFTHSDRLKESGKVGVEGVEKYISSQRRDLLELVKRCGDRYHVMERGSGGEEEEERKRRSVGELLEKVEQTVREGGGECFSCPLFQEAEDRVRQRQEEIVRERRGRGEEVKRQALHSYSMQPLRETEEDVDEEENERTREEAEKSVSALELENLPSLSSSSAWYSSLLRSVWEKVEAGASKVPKLTAGGALLGGVVGVFFGGPIGGAIGATAGSVVTEVGRRRFSQTKNSAEETDATGRIEGEILDKVLKTE